MNSRQEWSAIQTRHGLERNGRSYVPPFLHPDSPIEVACPASRPVRPGRQDRQAAQAVWANMRSRWAECRSLLPRAREICMRGEGRDLVIFTMLPTELKRKTLPGYSASSTPSALALLTVPSIRSTGALKWRWATCRVDSLV